MPLIRRRGRKKGGGGGDCVVTMIWHDVTHAAEHMHVATIN